MDDFKDTLEDVGVTLSTPISLQEPQSIIINKLQEKFRSNEDSSDGNESFIRSLKDLMEDEEMYISLFSPSIYKKMINDEGGNLTQNDIQQDSLIKILLNTSLQSKIMLIILEDITNVVVEVQENTSKLRMLLNTLKYLPFIDDSTALTTQLIDLLDIATLPAQLEILNLIPEILPDSENNFIGKELSKLLVSNSNLTGIIIDCLNALNLSPSIRFDVQQEIMNNIITSSKCIEIFPILFEFLITDVKSDNVHNVLMKVRSALENIFFSSDDTKEITSLKVIIIRKLATVATISRIVNDGWLNLISTIKVNNEHKSVDLLILFLLHGIGSNKKQVIEGIFKKRIKARLFKSQLIENCFEKYMYMDILQECLSSITEIGYALLKTNKEHLCVEFATQLYKSTFQNKNASFLHRQMILQNLILQTGFHNQDNVSSILQVFIELLDNKQLLKQHVLKLLELLEKLDMFDFKDTKTVFEILCSVTYFENEDEAMSSIQNEMHMLVRKHIASAKKSIKHRGIACAIVMAKHIATHDQDQSETELSSEQTYSSINKLPSDCAREAAKLLELAYLTTVNAPVLKGLYYDELTSMILFSKNLDKYFMSWLFETITINFEDVFVVENIPTATDGIIFSSQYCINSSEETETPINVNIAGLSVLLENQENNQILVLAPLFRLLRLLHYAQNDGDLQSIDALLGCGVIMPIIDCLDNFSISQLKKVSDCLFHCINWFRETMSAFVTQNKKIIRQKVLKRLNHIIELEKLLYKCMEYIPEHKLPNSYFYNVVTQSNKLGSPKKNETAKQRKRPRLNETEANETTVSQFTQAQQTAANAKKLKVEKIYIEFREIDTRTITLLKYPLGGNTIEETPTQQQTNLNLKQFNFLIRDFTSKLHTRLKGKTSSLSNLHFIEPKNLIMDCGKLLPMICKHLKTIKNSLNMMLEEDIALNSIELFTEEALELRTGFNTIIEMFSLVYGWSGFYKKENYELLITCLKGALHANLTENELTSMNSLIKSLINKLCNHEKYCLNLQSAVFLIETANSLYCLNMNPEYKKNIEEMSYKFISRRWYNNKKEIETGKQAFVAMDVLLKAYLKNKTIKELFELVQKLKEEAPQLMARKDYLKMLPSVDKGNFHILFRCVCHALLERLKHEIQSLANNQHLVLWKNVLTMLQELIDIIKIHENKSNLLSFFKKSNGIFKIFLTHGIPIFEIMLGTNPTEVIEILKTAQISTRFLQHLCCHSKLTKDVALMKFVPQCKCTLETIIYRVKAALITNNCTASFWMGNLKNKDLYGELILSQSTNNSSDMVTSEELLPEDDSDDDLFDNDKDDDAASMII